MERSSLRGGSEIPNKMAIGEAVYSVSVEELAQLIAAVQKDAAPRKAKP